MLVLLCIFPSWERVTGKGRGESKRERVRGRYGWARRVGWHGVNTLQCNSHSDA